MREFARVVLPHDCVEGPLFMLSAYFDDSGTHKNSDIVLVGGLLGNHYQWQFFSDEWANKLKNPSSGKLPLTRFHMTDCENGMGEFAGWGRTATDFLVRELGDIILRSGLHAAGFGVSRKDWDEIITGRLRNAMGDAEAFCVAQCYFQAEMWSRTFGGQRCMAFIFDNRPERTEQNKKISSLMTILAAQEEERFGRTNFVPISHTFASSRAILPLQGADLVAWEMYQQGMARIRGIVPPGKIHRSQFDRLCSSGRINFNIALGDSVQRFSNSVPDEAVEGILDLTKISLIGQFFE